MSQNAPSPAPTSSSPAFWENRRVVWLGAVLLGLCLLAAYHNSFRVPFLLDDEDSITKSTTIKSFSTALFPPKNSGITVAGRPLLNLSLAVNYRLGGTDVFGYHVGNLLIHIAAALALFGVLRRTFKLPSLAPRFGAHATPLAWFGAALWSLHPMQTESVTYVIQRAESLVGLFYFLTFYSFVRTIEKPSRLWPILTGALCFLGMAAKEVMASAPIILFLFDRAFVSGTFREAWAARKHLYLTLASSWAFLLVLVVWTGGRGSTVGFAVLGWWDYALMQTSAILRYLYLTFWPVDLVFDYGPVVEKRPLVLLFSSVGLLPLLAAGAWAVVKAPKIGFLAAWFFVILAPTSSFIPVATQTMAEHRMYVPIAALIIGTVVAIYKWCPAICWNALRILTIVLIVLTVNRNDDYKSNVSIWEDTVEKIPDNVRALNNLGVTYIDMGRFDDAIPVLHEAIELMPSYVMAYNNLAQAYIRKGLSEAGIESATDRASRGERNSAAYPGQKLERLSDSIYIKKSLEIFEKAVALAPDNALVVSCYGAALLSANQPEKALEWLIKASELDPKNMEAHFDLGNALSLMDRDAEAVAHFETVLKNDPDDVAVLNNLGASLQRLGRLTESIENLRDSVRLKPEAASAHSNLGVSLLAAGQLDEGIAELREALRLNPKSTQALYNLSNALAEKGETEEAIVHLEGLLRIAPPTAELVSNLGVLYARVGRFQEAVTATRRALAMDPNYEPAQENLAKITSYLDKRGIAY